MRLKALAARLPAASQAVAAIPPKAADPYYATAEWKALRARRLALDAYTCVVPGCGRQAVVVDHVVSRRESGDDVSVAALRSLCREHDNAAKEDHLGRRRGPPSSQGW